MSSHAKYLISVTFSNEDLHVLPQRITFVFSCILLQPGHSFLPLASQLNAFLVD